MSKKCSICLNNLNKGVKLSCDHIFHKHCINKYIKISIRLYNKSNCPLCRSLIIENPIIKQKDNSFSINSYISLYKTRLDMIKSKFKISSKREMKYQKLFIKKVNDDFNVTVMNVRLSKFLRVKINSGIIVKFKWKK